MRENTTYQVLAEYNSISNPNLIYPGQVIKIPQEQKNEAHIVNEIKVGDTVKVRDGAKDYNGVQLASFVYSRNHNVLEVNGDRVVITYGGIVVAAIHKNNLIKV